MPPSFKVLLGPQDTDFGIARLIELPDSSGRIEVFDEAARVWRPSSNPKLTWLELFDARPVSPDLAARLGLADPDTENAAEPPTAPTLGDVYPELKKAAQQLKVRQVNPELKKVSDKLVQAFVTNLNYNTLHDIDPDAPEADRQKAYRRGYSPKGLKARDEMIKNGYDPRTLVPSTVDGMPVYDRDRDEELNSLHILKAEKYPMPQDNSLLSAPHVLKPVTVKAVLAESLRVQQIADRWASGSPKKVKAMEASGTLLPRLKEQAELENSTISDARVGGAMSDVPDSEILALRDIPALPD